MIERANFSHDVWDLESFASTLFLGTTHGLYRLTANQEIVAVADDAFTRQVNCASLSAGHGRMWCFGSDVVSSSSDGHAWREETVL